MTVPNAQDSNDSLLSIAEESAVIGVLPGTPVWFALEPNSVGDFGGEPQLVTRKPIGSRKAKRGSITGIAPKAGFNIDYTKTINAKLLQGVMFNTIAEKVQTQPYNGTQIAITSVASADNSYNAGTGLAIFTALRLAYASGFTNRANNGLKHLATVAAGKLTVTEALVIEAAPPALAQLTQVGVQFTAGDASLTYAAPTLTLTTTTLDLTTIGLTPGEWIFIGGDTAVMCFASLILAGAVVGGGYARIASIAAHAMVFDKTTFAPGADAGAGKTVQLFYGDYLKDAADGADVKRSYTAERTLGSDGTGTQAEYVGGLGMNDITLNVPKKDKLNADYGLIGLTQSYNTGAVGVKAGTRIAALGEDAYNTSSDLYQARVQIVDPTTLNPTPLAGYSTSFTIKVSNNLGIDEAVGVVGGFDWGKGEFEVSASIELYFQTVAAAQAVRNKTDVTFHTICASLNAGFICDMPLVELGGGQHKVEKDKRIMMTLSPSAIVNPLGYVVWWSFFTYLPSSAMAAPQ